MLREKSFGVKKSKDALNQKKRREEEKMDRKLLLNSWTKLKTMEGMAQIIFFSTKF